jgi:ATP-dependent RNA helicase DHX36
MHFISLSDSCLAQVRGQSGGGRGRGPRAPDRRSPFDNLAATPPRALEQHATGSFREWWAAMSRASGKMDGSGMIEPQFVANFVAWLHENDADTGAILVFLSGLDDIKKVLKHLKTAQLRGVLLLPLHGSLTTAHQRAIFDQPPAGTRKIVLATNIAETSITIDDVTVVVDCGIHKVMTYDVLNKIQQLSCHWCAAFSICHRVAPAAESLAFFATFADILRIGTMLLPISRGVRNSCQIVQLAVSCRVTKANAKQRSGRAGRVQAGKCYRLYPKSLHDALPDFLAPEIQRMSLEDICLKIKSIGALLSR